MIHIACNIDANFIQHCAVTLVSLFENNKRADIILKQRDQRNSTVLLRWSLCLRIISVPIFVCIL